MDHESPILLQEEPQEPRVPTEAPRDPEVDLLRIFGPTFTLTPEEARVMESLEQRSPEWFSARINRITASNFGSAAGLNPYCSPDFLLIQLLYKSFEGNAATKWGTQMEPVACAAYVQAIAKDPVYSDGGPVPSWRDSGLSIAPQWPFLGASPDGIVTTHRTSSTVSISHRCAPLPKYDLMRSRFDPGVGIISEPAWTPPTTFPHNYLLEIKCPFRKKLYGPIPPYYYAQIQGCMQILDLPYSHFYVWTPNTASTVAYPRNDNFWNDFLLPRLTDFYFERYMPLTLLKAYGLLDTSDRFGPNTDWLLPKKDTDPLLVQRVFDACKLFRSKYYK
jgi:putative phage-type endonuclease